MDNITLALTKGDRILSEELRLLKQAGIEPAEDIERSRKLVFDTSCTGLRLMLLRGSEPPLPPRIKVATKFVNTAKRYYAEQGIQVDIIKLYGAMELAPIVGLAHRIVDIVETGNTLKANGLKPLDHICDISTRLIVNKVSMKMKHAAVRALVDKLEAITEAP
jgi:ATP phosphoribosyltransferase